MTFSSRRWISGAHLAALAVILAYAAEAHAEPVDAVPLDRPGTRMIETWSPPPEPEMTSPAPAADAALASPPAPGLGASPLRAPEPAIARIRFEPDTVTLNGTAMTRLKTFADEFRHHGGRVALKAYAGRIGDSSTTARRLSLKRVLAVREFLLAQGIAAERLEVRALAGARDSGPLDRVDITRPGS